MNRLPADANPVEAPTAGFPHMAVDPLDDTPHDRNPGPTFASELTVQRILDAVETRANNTNEWMEIPA